jgi:hypothetical protein
MMRSVVVSYRVKPEAVAEHQRLCQAVFQQLRDEQPDHLSYEVLLLDDGVSFVHVSTADLSDGQEPLPSLQSFKEFSAGLGDRVETQPNPTQAAIVGSYRPAHPTWEPGP